MNAALLSPFVTPMPIVKTLAALIVVPVKLDLLETEKHARVSEHGILKYLVLHTSVLFSEGKSKIKVMVLQRSSSHMAGLSVHRLSSRPVLFTTS